MALYYKFNYYKHLAGNRIFFFNNTRIYQPNILGLALIVN